MDQIKPVIIKFFLLTASICLTASIAISQALDDFNKFKDKYPKANVIATKYKCNLDIGLKKDKIVVSYSNLEELLFLGSSNSGYSKRTIYFSDFFKLKNYSAWSETFVKNGYVKQYVKDFKKNEFVSDNIFHDDAGEFVFMFPNPSKGDKTVIDVEYELSDPHILPSFSLNPYLDYENVEFSVRVENKIKLVIDTFFLARSGLSFETSSKGKYTIYVWKGSVNKTFNRESNSISSDWISTQLLFRIAEYEYKESIIKVLPDINELYKWNYRFLDSALKDVHLMKPLADSITLNQTDTLQMINSIYKWVQNNIRYIAIETGYSGLIPACASTVSNARYGDCKGMASILYGLLRAKGIKACFTWIGTRDLPFRYSVTPSPHVDNHMIASVNYQGKWYFLDGTGDNIPFGKPSPFIQGKEALISIDSNHFEIKEVPVVPADENLFIDSCYLQLDGNVLKGSGLATLTGYHHMRLTDRLTNPDYNSIRNYCRSLLIKGNNKFVLDTIWLVNLHEKDAPLYIHYTFTIENYALWIDKECFINLNLDKITLPGRISNDRDVAIDYSFTSKEINKFVIENKGLKVETLPTNHSLNYSEFKFSNEYTFDKEKIYRTQSYSRNILVVEPSEFPSFNKFIDSINKNYSQQVILTKP